jgi:hypothetical protein
MIIMMPAKMIQPTHPVGSARCSIMDPLVVDAGNNELLPVAPSTGKQRES